MVLSENNARVLLSLASDLAEITQNPEGLLVTPKRAVRRYGWTTVMLVGLLSPFDGRFDAWNAIITIPRANLPPNFLLHPPPDEYAEPTTKEPAEATPVKLGEKDIYIRKLRDHFGKKLTPDEVSASLKFLVQTGMSAEQVSKETGASIATVYRSLRLSAEKLSYPSQALIKAR